MRYSLLSTGDELSAAINNVNLNSGQKTIKSVDYDIDSFNCWVKG